MPVGVVVVLGVVLGLITSRSPEPQPPLTPPVAGPPVTAGAPPELTIARAEGVQVNLPIDPAVITAAAFHPVDEPGAVGLESTGGIPIQQGARNERPGAETAGLDIGAPVGTPVYAPVDGVVVSVAPYKVVGDQVRGYELSIAPDVASRGVVLRMTHLNDPETGDRPQVGMSVQVGQTLLGRVIDMSDLGRQELANFTSDSGNHVHLELLRTEADLR